MLAEHVIFFCQCRLTRIWCRLSQLMASILRCAGRCRSVGAAVYWRVGESVSRARVAGVCRKLPKRCTSVELHTEDYCPARTARWRCILFACALSSQQTGNDMGAATLKAAQASAGGTADGSCRSGQCRIFWDDENTASSCLLARSLGV